MGSGEDSKIACQQYSKLIARQQYSKLVELLVYLVKRLVILVNLDSGEVFTADKPKDEAYLL